MVVDSLSCKSAGSSVGEMCMRIFVDFPLSGLIREAYAEGVRNENWKQEMIRWEIVDPVWSGLGCGFWWDHADSVGKGSEVLLLFTPGTHQDVSGFDIELQVAVYEE